METHDPYSWTHDMTAEFEDLHQHARDCSCPQCNGDGEERDERRICPHCNGTTLSPYPDDGGSCPHCFGGYLK